MARYNCILLAAGFSRRFGGNKLLSDFNGRPLWRWTFEALCALRDSYDLSVTVVSQYDEILEAAQSAGAFAVRNPTPELGASSSVRLGAQKAAHSCSEDGYLLFFVADQPYLSIRDITALLDALQRSGKRLGALSHAGTPGNPVAFGVEYLHELTALTGDRGGKPILLRHLSDAVLVEATADSLTDIDTP